MPYKDRKGALHAFERVVVELAAQVVIPHARTPAVRSDRHAFQHRMRIAEQQFAILARARFGFVGIAEHVLLARLAMRHERQLRAVRQCERRWVRNNIVGVRFLAEDK